MDVIKAYRRFAKFQAVTNYQILQTWEVGGSNPQFWKGEFGHTPQYAVVQFCQVVDQTDAPNFVSIPLTEVTSPTDPASSRNRRASSKNSSPLCARPNVPE